MGFLGFFRRKEDGNVTLPESDTERWITGTYAMWSEYADGDWHYFAGSRQINKRRPPMRAVLRRDWGVTDENTLSDMVLYLISQYEDENDCSEEEIALGAWDLCRACQILGMGFIGGYIERREMVEKSVRVGRIMQRLYHSWDELYDSYLEGYKEWRRAQGGEWQRDIAEREKLCLKLRNDPDGPCSIAWEIELT